MTKVNDYLSQIRETTPKLIEVYDIVLSDGSRGFHHYIPLSKGLTWEDEPTEIGVTYAKDTI